MEKVLLFAGLLICCTACASQKKTATRSAGDDRRGTAEFLDERTYLLEAAADDKSYGYDPSNPVKVGGATKREGPLNERRFLNALLGPQGERTGFFRQGSCCHFKTPNALIGNRGLLDIYKVYWEGSKDTVTLYLNMYDEDNLRIPVGFTARKKR